MGDLTGRLTARLLRGETILFLVWLLVLPASATAQSTLHRAGLVIRFGDGSVVTRCVTFSESSITGVELLTRAGLAIRVDASSSIGAGVCKIGREGCDRGKSCFCQCEGSTCAYWQYFHLQNGTWKYSSLGAGVYQISDGAVEGWAWGNNVAPPVMTLDQICANVSSAPAPTNAQVTRAPTSVPTSASQPATPTVAPTVVPVTPTVIPTTAPSTPAATDIPSATVTPLASATFPLAGPTSTPTFISLPQNASVPSSVVSYAAFGIIVLGLGAWLAIQARRKAS